MTFWTAALLFTGSSRTAQGQDFKAQQFSRSAEIVLNGNIKEVFPLFGAIEEKKWSPDWNPMPVFPSSGEIGEGFIFKTPGHVHGEGDITWVVADYDTIGHRIQYIITASNRVTILKIFCVAVSGEITRANISYKMTGLDPDGNEISRHLLDHLFSDNLKDWEKAINNCLTSLYRK